jgi:uncharacterized protein YodC (DUF2158 family)
MKFEISEFVRLRSGGPWMTIESMDEEKVHCMWFSQIMEGLREKHDQLHRGVFLVHTLESMSEVETERALRKKRETEARAGVAQ